jgi:cytochrome c553
LSVFIVVSPYPEKMMRTIAAKLSDVEIKAVSEYAAGLR